MRNYLLKVPDHQWNASSPAKSSFQNLKIQYLGTAGFILSDQHRTIVLDGFVA